MAWEWSHSVEAYENLRENLTNSTEEFLREVYEEWKVWEDTGKSSIPLEEDFLRTKAKLRGNYPDGEAMADYIYTRAEEQSTCENGGFEAWVCPWGCHTRSFSREE